MGDTDIPAIPRLVHGAMMPSEEELPRELKIADQYRYADN